MKNEEEKREILSENRTVADEALRDVAGGQKLIPNVEDQMIITASKYPSPKLPGEEPQDKGGEKREKILLDSPDHYDFR